MLAGIYDLSDTGARADYAVLRKAMPQATAFSSLAYADAIMRARGLRAQIHLPDPQAAAIVFLRGHRLYGRVTVPPFTQYSALLLDESDNAKDIHARTSPLENLLHSIEKVRPRADLLCRLQDPRPAKWRGWLVTPLYTYLLNPADDDRLWSSTTRRVHRNRADQFDIEESLDLAPAVIDLCEQSYARHGRGLPGGRKPLLDTVEQLGPQTRTFVALHEGRPQAGMVLLQEGPVAHYWISGSLPGPAMTVLIGQVLPVLRDAGITRFDFVGANTPSIAEFKRRFAPRLDMYFHLRRHPLAKLIR